MLLQLVSALVQGGVSESEIGIIAPYRQQIKLIRGQMVGRHPRVEILTADQAQGRDKECMVLSMVRNNGEMEVGQLLQDWRRINVCLTRAKRKLVLFGSLTTLHKSTILDAFFNLIRPRQWIYHLPPDALRRHKALLSPSLPTKTTTTSKRPADSLSSPSTPIRPSKLGHRRPSAISSFGILRDVTLNLFDHNPSPSNR